MKTLFISHYGRVGIPIIHAYMWPVLGIVLTPFIANLEKSISASLTENVNK